MKFNIKFKLDVAIGALHPESIRLSTQELSELFDLAKEQITFAGNKVLYRGVELRVRNV